MFLGVSATLVSMQEMSDGDRERLGGMVRQTRLERYDTKMAAYQAAGVNAATWDRIERGQSVKEHTLATVIKSLWPSAGGDWRNVPGVYLPCTGSAVSSWEDEVTEHGLKIEAWLNEIQERVELLEKAVYMKQASEERDGDDGNDAPIEKYGLAVRRGKKDNPNAGLGDEGVDEPGEWDGA